MLKCKKSYCNQWCFLKMFVGSNEACIGAYTENYTPKGLFTLSDCDCERDVLNSWVLLVSVELSACSDVKH